MRNLPFLAAGVVMMALTAGQSGVATVKSETLSVYEKRDVRTNVVKTLKQGDQVVIEMSIMAEDNAQWCSIRQNGQKEQRLGYVRCEFLQRQEPPKADAAAAAPAAPANAPPAARSAAPAAQPPGPGRMAPDFWDPYYRRTAGESRWMGYARILASTFSFTDAQKQQVLQLAERNGIPGCIEESDSYFRRGLASPDLLSSSPITTCDWYAQYFREQVFALVTAEQRAAASASYRSLASEIAGNRRVLEMKSQRAR